MFGGAVMGYSGTSFSNITKGRNGFRLRHHRSGDNQYRRQDLHIAVSWSPPTVLGSDNFKKDLAEV